MRSLSRSPTSCFPFFFCRRMTLTADLLLLLYRMVRLETQKKSSFHSFILFFSLNLFLCVFWFLVGCVIRFFLWPRSIKNNSEYVGPNLLLFHSTISFWLVWLSPGEVDGKFRNGFQQWWIASFLRKQSPSPSAPGRQLAHKTTDKLCEKPRTDHQNVGHCCHRSNSIRRPSCCMWEVHRLILVEEARRSMAVYIGRCVCKLLYSCGLVRDKSLKL